MKVLHLGKYYPPFAGGIETVLQNICEGIKDKCDLTVIVSNTYNKTEIHNTNFRLIKTAAIKNMNSLPISPGYFFAVKTNKADIYHVHNPNPLAELSALMLNKKAKIVSHFHSDIVKQKYAKKIYSPFLYKYYDRADIIIAPTPKHITSSENINLLNKKCVVIPYGIDDAKYYSLNDHQESRVSNLKSSGKPVLLYVGRLVYYKGIEYLLNAMLKIDAILFIVGVGPLETRLKEIVNKNKLNRKVIFAGNVDDLSLVAYYHAADIFILPSIGKGEMFGMVQLEAMASSKPVISTELGTGVSWVNQNGKTGIVVEPKNSDALIEAVNYLINNPEIRTKMGSEGKKRVQENFTITKMNEAIMNLYRSLVN